MISVGRTAESFATLYEIDLIDLLVLPVDAAGKEPVVLAGLSNVNVNSGKSAKLECDVAFGKPKAEVKW